MLNYVSMITEFIEFIQEEMKKRGWSQADLASRFPGTTDFEITMIDNVERLLTNSRDQTRYLKNISTIITVIFIFGILGFIITLFQ